jgi:hypothetical protein
MKIEVICRPESLAEIKQITGVQPFSYDTALRRTLAKIQDNEIASSWKDSFISSRSDSSLKDYLDVPKYGCFVDLRTEEYDDREKCLTEFFFRRRKRMVRSKSLESSRFYGFIGWRTGTETWKNASR